MYGTGTGRYSMFRDVCEVLSVVRSPKSILYCIVSFQLLYYVCFSHLCTPTVNLLQNYCSSLDRSLSIVYLSSLCFKFFLRQVVCADHERG